MIWWYVPPKRGLSEEAVSNPVIKWIPITCCPCSCNKRAAISESTPPLMATAVVCFIQKKSGVSDEHPWHGAGRQVRTAHKRCIFFDQKSLSYPTAVLQERRWGTQPYRLHNPCIFYCYAWFPGRHFWHTPPALWEIFGLWTSVFGKRRMRIFEYTPDLPNVFTRLTNLMVNNCAVNPHKPEPKKYHEKSIYRSLPSGF